MTRQQIKDLDRNVQRALLTKRELPIRWAGIPRMRRIRDWFESWFYEKSTLYPEILRSLINEPSMWEDMDQTVLWHIRHNWTIGLHSWTLQDGPRGKIEGLNPFEKRKLKKLVKRWARSRSHRLETVLNWKGKS